VGYHFFYPNEDKFLLRFANPVKTGSYFQYVCLSFLTIKTPGMRKFIMLSSLFFFSMAGYSQFVIFGAKAGVNFATVTGNADHPGQRTPRDDPTLRLLWPTRPGHAAGFEPAPADDRSRPARARATASR